MFFGLVWGSKNMLPCYFWSTGGGMHLPLDLEVIVLLLHVGAFVAGEDGSGDQRSFVHHIFRQPSNQSSVWRTLVIKGFRIG